MAVCPVFYCSMPSHMYLIHFILKFYNITGNAKRRYATKHNQYGMDEILADIRHCDIGLATQLRSSLTFFKNIQEIFKKLDMAAGPTV